MIQFYAPDIKECGELPESESLHCCRVLRKQPGDEIIVTNGKGSRFRCTITESHPKHTRVVIDSEEKIPRNRNYELTLAVAPTKNTERMEWMVEKAVEIGIDRIVLIKCERSERKLIKTERLQKIIISALKQSLEVNKPVLTDMVTLKEFISQGEKEVQKFFGYCSKRYPRKEFAKEYMAGGSVIVMIGPEGDFTENEVETLINSGYIPVTFGEKRLRTETAGVYAVCAVQVINQLL